MLPGRLNVRRFCKTCVAPLCPASETGAGRATLGSGARMHPAALVLCALAAIGSSTQIKTARADDDRQTYMEGIKGTQRRDHDELEDRKDAAREAARQWDRYYRYGYATAVPYDFYDPYQDQYYYDPGRPNQYYYAYPDRYYTRRYYDRYYGLTYRSQNSRDNRGVYGYDRPYSSERDRYYGRHDHGPDRHYQSAPLKRGRYYPQRRDIDEYRRR